MKKTSFLRVTILTALLVLMMLALGGCAKKIDLKDYIGVKYHGYNGYAYVYDDWSREQLDALVDAEKLNKYVQQVFPNEYAFGAALGVGMDFVDLLSFSFDKSENLSNGDTITLRIMPCMDLLNIGETMESMEKALGISLDSTELTFTVDGLEDAQVLDAFACLEDIVDFSGANGYGSIVFSLSDYSEDNPFTFEKDGFYFLPKNPDYVYVTHSISFNLVYDNKDMGSLTFTGEQDSLSNGGTGMVTLTENGVSSSLSNIGYVLAAEEQSYDVFDLGEYVTSAEQLTEGSIQNVTSDALEISEDRVGLDEPQYVSTYLGTLKSTAISDYHGKCRLVVVVSYRYTGWFGSHGTSYAALCFDDLSLKSNDDFSGKNAEIETGGSSESDILSMLDSRYTYEKIQ